VVKSIGSFGQERQACVSHHRTTQIASSLDAEHTSAAMGVRRAVATPAVAIPSTTNISVFTSVTAAAVGVAPALVEVAATVTTTGATVSRRATTATSRTRSRAPIGRVLGAKQAHGDEVAKHRFVERDERIAGENEAVIIFQAPIRLLNEQGLGPGQGKEVIRPGHHLHLAKVFSASRGRPELFHPRRRTENGDGRGLVERVRRDPGQLEMSAVTQLLPHRLELAIPRRETQGEAAPIHHSRRRHLVTHSPARAHEEEV
jgi:hypothetical protein